MNSKYLGVKIITAVAMNRQDYNDYRGWIVPPDENPEDEGYLVEYEPTEPPTPNTEDRLGYVSWSPKDVFDEAYRKTEGLTFGLAIEAIKKGAKIARSGWNGKGMFIYLEDSFGMPPGNSSEESSRSRTEPVFVMYTADGKWQPGWLASQPDMLAEDWKIVG